MQWPLRKAAQRLRQRLARGRIMSSIKPELGCPGGSDKRAMPQALHPGGPLGLRDRSSACGVFDTEELQGSQRNPGVRHLMRTEKARLRQIEETGGIKKRHAAVFFPDLPVMVGDVQRCADRLGPRLDDRESVWRLLADDTGDARLEDASLLRRDLGQSLHRGTAGDRAKPG